MNLLPCVSRYCSSIEKRNQFMKTARQTACPLIALPRRAGGHPVVNVPPPYRSLEHSACNSL